MAFAADSHVRWMHSEDYCSFEDIVVTTKRHRRCHVAAAIAAAQKVNLGRQGGPPRAS